MTGGELVVLLVAGIALTLLSMTILLVAYCLARFRGDDV